MVCFCVCKTFVRINVLKMSPYSPKHPLRHNGPAMKRKGNNTRHPY
jgi:hypothetical protein